MLLTMVEGALKPRRGPGRRDGFAPYAPMRDLSTEGIPVPGCKLV
jgi:hypothetical protein